MNEFEEKSELSEELKAALYAELKKHGYKVTGGYRNPTHDEDAFDKVDVFYTIDGKQVPVQLRAYKKDYNLPGFPIRDTPLKTGSEMDKLKAGELDDMLFAYATAARVQDSKWGKYKFLTIKIAEGRSLRQNVDKIVGERTFPGMIRLHDFPVEANHVSFVADPDSTKILRNWV
jgi:hypothetical protein